MSARCTDVRVNLVTPRLFALADTPEKMIKLSHQCIEDIIRTCGLAPRKAASILELSHQLNIQKYQSQVPDDIDALETLPGVGHKTASVEMTQAFDQAAFPVDTHIHRCAKRWGLSRGKNVVETEKDLKRLFPKNLWKKLHLQIIYFLQETIAPRKNTISRFVLFAHGE